MIFCTYRFQFLAGIEILFPFQKLCVQEVTLFLLVTNLRKKGFDYLKYL